MPPRPGTLEPQAHLLAVPPRSHRWSRRATIELEELVDVPLLLTRRDFGSRQWFDAACKVAHIRPHVLLESGAPPTLIALAQAGYGVAIVPSNARIPRGLRAVPILLRGESIGAWASVSWGSAQVPGAVRRAIRRRAGGVLSARVPAPRTHPARAALPRPKEPPRGVL